MSFPRPVVRWWFLLLSLAAFARSPTGAQEAAPAATGDAYKPIGPQLFPIYQNYVRTADGTNVRNVLYLYTSTENPSGAWSKLALPLFYREHGVSPPRERLYLFPLLFFSKASDEESYNYALPLFYDYRTPSTLFQLIVPLWARLQTEGRKLSRQHYLFPLFRYTRDERAEAPASATRLGVWKILEFWESLSTPAARAHTALNFFNWQEETTSGLPLYKYRWSDEADGPRGRTHLFPFYLHQREPGWDRLWVAPFWWRGVEPRAQYLWVVPFFGRWQNPESSGVFIIPLLSGFGEGPGGERSVGFLFPLFGYRSGPKRYNLLAFPLYDYAEDPQATSFGVLFWLYRSRYERASGKRTHSILYPLGHFDVEPDGSRGNRWFFPYIETFNRERLWRFVVPLYLERQTLAGGETDSFFRVGLPVYFSYGQPDDYFALGFPLYWGARDGPRGWHLFIPTYFHSYSATSFGRYVLPFYGHRSFPSRRQLFVGGPLYVHQRFYDLEGRQRGTSHAPLWPLTTFEERDDGYHYRLLPLFWVSKEGETSDLLLASLYYQQSGPAGTHRYLIPFYGRYETPALERDYYAAGTFIHTRENDAAGAPARFRQDYLWGLASFEDDVRSGSAHEHVLPVGYWRTQSRSEDRTVAGPFYYAHRIRDDDEEHRLRLVLGNLYFSKVVTEEVEPPPAGTPAATAKAATATEAGAPPEATPAPEAAAAPEFGPALPPAMASPPPPAAGTRELWRDTGALWPLTRSYRSVDGQEAGAWAIPFYFNVKDAFSTNFALFPLYFGQQETIGYNPTIFRYPFLFDRETWDGGHRWTAGQLLFDWLREEKQDRLRWRFLYPLFEHERTTEGYQFDIFNPLARFESVERRGERIVNQRLLPIYWRGSRDRQTTAGSWQREEQHFFLFPLFGVQARVTRVDTYVLFPFFHLLTSRDALNFELWPSIFYRSEAGIQAFRVWPLHANESGATAGEFVISRYLFISKFFSAPQGTTYRLDPFLLAISRRPEESSENALFYLYYNRRGKEDSWFHALPLVYGGSGGWGGFQAYIPLHYYRDFGKDDIDYATPWRFFFVTNYLRGQNGERHRSLLWKLLEYTDNPREPQFHETRVLQEIYFDRKTATSRQFVINPLFSYYRNDAEDETRFSLFYQIYSSRTLRGKTTRSLFYFLEWE